MAIYSRKILSESLITTLNQGVVTFWCSSHSADRQERNKLYDIWYFICYLLYVMWYMIRYYIWYDMIRYDSIRYDIWYDTIHDIWYDMIYEIWYMIWYLIRYIFINYNWVVTRWQYTFTHKQYAEQHK